MVNKLRDLKSSGYRRLQDQNIVYSYIGDPLRDLRSQCDRHLDTITFNNSQMKARREQYNRDATARAQNATFQEFEEIEAENRKKIEKVKANIAEMKKMASQAALEEEEKMIRDKEVEKYTYRLRECLQMQIHQDHQINKLIETKKERVMKNMPEGVTLEQIIMGPQYSEKLKNAASDLQAKIEALMHLAESIRECSKLMKQIQFLVGLQGQKIEKAYAHVLQANKDLDRADKQLRAKVEQQSSGLKKKCLIIVIAIIVIAAIAFILYEVKVF